MPNLTLKPGAKAARAKPRGRRRSRHRHTAHGWLEAAKIVFLLQRMRSRRSRSRSSPSLRQIALVVVSGGLVLVIVRVATQRVKNRAGEAPSPPTAPVTGAAATGNESPLADRVQDEMFNRSDAVHPDA